jgi:hypothetical protein
MLRNLRKLTVGSLAAGVMLLASAQAARADIILADPIVTPSGGNFLWTYSVTLTNGEALSGLGANPGAGTTDGAGVTSANYQDYFVIYDFAGYAGGVATTIANTSATAQATGPTPGNIFPPDTSMTNLVFVYTGPFLPGAGAVIGTVSALSTFGGTSLTPNVIYASSITDNAGVPGGTDNKISAVVGPVPVVPEPGSMLLFGTGLVGLARRLRRRVA